jgi:hypothetical protein
MTRDPALTFRGALVILGQYDRPTLDSVDTLLGGGVLGDRVAAGTSLFGLLDPRGEAARLVRGLLDQAGDRAVGATGHERHQLISAAHTVLVISAFFTALRDALGTEAYARLALTRDEQVALADGETAVTAAGTLDRLLTADVALPTAVCGFRQNAAQHLTPFFADVAQLTLRFLRGLAFWRQLEYDAGTDLPAAVVAASLVRYEDDYRRLAAQVPEFFIWATLVQADPPQSAPLTAKEEFLGALQDRPLALTRLHNLLSLIGGVPRTRPHRAVLARANRAALSQPVLATGGLRQASPAFPTVSECYVTPRFQVAQADHAAAPADDAWWHGLPVREDLDHFLAAYLCSPASARHPLVVLGEPGAGKSLFTRVVAAQLPDEAYAAVRVPLRRVEASLPVADQIDRALAVATNDRVSWQELSEESADVVRVVLLDALDELLQAGGAPDGYLEAVAAFQSAEAAAGRPVAVIVTARTVAADRVRVPAGSPVIRLVDFDRGQVTGWLDAWREANGAAAADGTLRPLSVEAAVRHPDLAGRPLLLSMLALYTADPGVPDPAGEPITTATLYRRLIEAFVRRELGRGARSSRSRVDDTEVQERLWHLALAAYGMFNRGRQEIGEEDLDRDLDALLGTPPADAEGYDEPLTRAQRTVGQFFFVHAAPARGFGRGRSRRSYEFVHPTVGEYLVAATTLDLLDDMGRRRATARRSQFDDDGRARLLHALLSHQPLVKRWPIISFARQLFAERPSDMARRLLRTLDDLISESTYTASALTDRYRPSGPDVVRRTAAYTANVLTLRVLLAERVDLVKIAPENADPDEWRRSLVRLWRAGLDPEGRSAVLASLTVSPDGASLVSREPPHLPRLGRYRAAERPGERAEVAEVDLLADPALTTRLHLGGLAWEGVDPAGGHAGSPTADALVALAFEVDPARLEPLYRTIATAGSQVSPTGLAHLLRCLARDAARLPYATVEPVAALLARRAAAGGQPEPGPGEGAPTRPVAGHPRPGPGPGPGPDGDQDTAGQRVEAPTGQRVDAPAGFEPEQHELARVVAAHPELLRALPELWPRLGHGFDRLQLLTAATLAGSTARFGHSEGMIEHARAVLDSWVKTDYLLSRARGRAD